MSATQSDPSIHAHPAAPLTETTRPYYEALDALRTEGWTGNLQSRYRIAELTQLIWKEARNGHQKRN